MRARSRHPKLGCATPHLLATALTVGDGDPGKVDTGTLIRRLGRSSLTLGQGMFVDAKCVAVAESVMVLMDPSTRRPKPWPEPLARQLRELTAD